MHFGYLINMEMAQIFQIVRMQDKGLVIGMIKVKCKVKQMFVMYTRRIYLVFE